MFAILLSLSCAEEKNCKVLDVSSSANTVAQIVSPIKKISSLYPELLGPEEMVPVMDINSISNLLIGSILIGLCLFLALALIMCFWMLIAQCSVCCCCFMPKKGEKFTICQMIHNIISMGLMLAASILFFVASTKVQKGLDEIVKLPDGINRLFDNLSDSVDSTVNNVFGVLDDTINETSDKLSGMVTFLGKFENDIIPIVPGIRGNISKFNDYFAAGSNYRSSVTDLANDLSEPVKNLYEGVTEIVEGSTKEALNLVKIVDDNKDTIKNATKSGNDTLTSTISSIQGNISDIKSRALESLQPVHDIGPSLSSKISPIGDIVIKYKTLIIFVFYIIFLITIIVTLAYGILFFFNCCLSRCLFAWFHCFGCIVNCIILVPAAVFLALFFVLFAACPQILDLVSGMGDSMGVDKEQISSLFLCEDQSLSVYDLLLKDMFNVTEIIDGLTGDFTGSLESALNFDLGADFNSFNGSYNPEEKFITYTMTGAFSFLDGLQPDIDAMSTDAKGKAENINKILRQNHTTNSSEPQKFLEAALDGMNLMVTMGNKVSPTFNETKKAVVGLVGDFTDKAANTVEDGLGKMKCTMVSCVYAPLNNTLCLYLLDACAFGLMSGFIMLFGLICMSINVCRRRRRMKKIEVEEESSFDEYSNNDDEKEDGMSRTQI